MGEGGEMERAFKVADERVHRDNVEGTGGGAALTDATFSFEIAREVAVQHDLCCGGGLHETSSIKDERGEVESGEDLTHPIPIDRIICAGKVAQEGDRLGGGAHHVGLHRGG